MKKVLVLLIFLLAGAVWVSGCSKSKPQAVPEPTVSEPAELPELEQNLIYKTNVTKPTPPPDYSFKESENTFQTIPEEEVKKQPHND